MIYIIRNADQTIKTYSEKEDDSLVGGESRETYAGSMAEYAARFTLSASKNTIAADGNDESIVTVTTNTGASSIDVSVNGVSVAVPIGGGVGTLPPISAEIAGFILIQPADKTLYCAAGLGSILIEAKEGV